MNALDVLKALRVVNASLHRDGDGLVLNSPRGAVSAELAGAIRENRNELLVLLEMAGDSAGGGASIEPLPRPENIPLGLTQQRFWYLASVAPESPIYNLPAAFRLTGVLDVAALETAINLIIARHEVLRTRVDEHGNEVVQAIETEVNFRLDKVDIASHGAAAMDELIRQIDIACSVPIPMERAPMLKATLYHLGPEQHVLFWMPHHVIWDGWSFDIFLKELQQLYSALEAGSEPDIEPLTLQYADYAVWQRQQAEGDKLSHQMDYWSTQLSGELPVLDLATDRPRPEIMSFNGGRAVLDIDGATIERLTQIGREEGATLFMVLLAGFYAFLYRYTGQQDLIVGSPVQSRIYEDTDNIIGVFVNTLVLRTQLSPALSFRELIGKVKAMCISAYDHQDTPFEVLAEKFESERTMSRNALYQVLFSYQDVTNRDSNLGSLSLDQIHIETSVVPTDLTVWLMETGKGLIGGFDYATELFDPDTIEKMITHYCQLLSAGAASPLAAIGSLPMIAESELAWLAQHAAGPVLELPPLSINQIIEEKALQIPDAIAVKDVNTSLTYQQLLNKTELITAQLQSHGIGVNNLVGVCVKRNVDLLPILLGIFKSGAAYVPLDPDFPDNRLEHMILDAAVEVIITDEKAIKSLPQKAGVAYLMSEKLLDSRQTHGEVLPQAELPTSRLAYVIYTSGSTGKPKGVEIPHHAAVNLLLSMQELLSIQNSDQLLAITTLSFDISVLELFLPLLAGATVIIADEETTRDAVALKLLTDMSKPSIMQATPASWRMLKDVGWEGSGAMTVLCGGEEMPRDLAQWLCASNKRVLNVYGPTETTVWSSMYQVQGDEEHMPIGAPIHNTRMYVLDKQLNPLPVGVRGNLYIAGDGVAAGYRNLADMTAEHFVADTVLNNGTRMYCTGDQAKRRLDGLLEFYGRNDNQVKIRGFRIELGEIETCLLTHPAVKQGVVTVREDSPGDTRLMAYVVVEPGQNVTVTEVRKHLRSNLPDYMIPQHVVELDTLPMTPNGKIDRKSLPAPFDSVVMEEEFYIEPRTEMEREIAKIWQEVLDMKNIGIHDNFFDLGGHSLSSIQVIALIRDRLEIKLTPRAMLMNNLEQVAQQCNAANQNKIDDDKQPVTAKLLNKIMNKVRI